MVFYRIIMIINKEHTSFEDFNIPKPNFWLIFEKSLIDSKRQFFIHFDKQYLFSILSSKENTFIKHFCSYVRNYILNHWFTIQSLNKHNFAHLLLYYQSVLVFNSLFWYNYKDYQEFLICTRISIYTTLSYVAYMDCCSHGLELDNYEA